MFEFFKNLFQSKTTQSNRPIQLQEIDKNHRVVIDDSQIEKEKVKEKEILTIFGNNLPLFHRVVVPIYNLVKEFGIGIFDFSSLVKKGYIPGNIGTLSKYIKSINTSCRNGLYNDFSRRFGTEIADEFTECLFDECIIPFFELSYAHKTDMERFQETFKKVLLNDKIKNEVRDFLKEQIKSCFIKYFTYVSYIKEVDNIDELTKILINASYKYQDIEVISEETYEIFMDYMQLDENHFPLNIYNEFIAIYVATKNVCRDFYKEEEILLDFDYKSMTISDSVDLIIETRVYQNFDIDKLVLSLLYHNISAFDSVSAFIKELDNLKTLVSKIKKARTKYDLLNNNYNTKQTTISDIDLMNGIEFEKFLSKLLTKLNFTCENTKASGDQGVDIIAEKDNNKIAIQAKCYSQPVGNHAVMEAIAGAKFYNANQCMVITNSTFTKAAKDLATANGVVLWDRKVLIEKLKEI